MDTMKERPRAHPPTGGAHDEDRVGEEPRRGTYRTPEMKAYGRLRDRTHDVGFSFGP